MVAVVTGAAGFAGYNLVKSLLDAGCFVYAVVRPASQHNRRLQRFENLRMIECDMLSYNELPSLIKEPVHFFFHLAWQGKRHDFEAQYRNIPASLAALEAAARMGCKRFLCTGSQAEYGLQEGIVTEENRPHPNCAYGAAKLAACVLTRQRAADLGMEWVWGRIFSLYGLYEPQGRLLPDLVAALQQGQSFSMTSAKQDWDYLYSVDGAEALMALAERGKAGEIYNVANGDYHPLREFTESVREEVAPYVLIHYGEDARAPLSLRPSVKKIQQDTGWNARTSFMEGIRSWLRFQDTLKVRREC